MTLMQLPPLVVVLDAGHKGVRGMPPRFATDYGFQLSLMRDVAFGPDSLAVVADFAQYGVVTLEVPYAAIYRISSTQLQESHIYQLDAEIAQARHQLYSSPTRTMVH